MELNTDILVPSRVLSVEPRLGALLFCHIVGFVSFSMQTVGLCPKIQKTGSSYAPYSSLLDRLSVWRYITSAIVEASFELRLDHTFVLI